MAKITWDGANDFRERLMTLDVGVYGIAKYAIYPAAGMLADALKQACPKDSGDLADSLSIAKFKNDGGHIYTQISFTGYDEKGQPNSVKARVLESGRSDVKNGEAYKRPFVRTTVNKMKQRCIAEIGRNFEKKIKEIMK